MLTKNQKMHIFKRHPEIEKNNLEEILLEAINNPKEFYQDFFKEGTINIFHRIKEITGFVLL
jgi:hypothetical protein